MPRGLLLLLAAAPLAAQNSDFGILFNVSVSRFNFGTRTETQ